MLFYKHKNSFILPPYVRAYVQPMTSFPVKMTSCTTDTHFRSHMGGYSLRTHACVRMTSLPCVRTQRHLHTQKLLTSFWREIYPIWGYSHRTHAYARMTSFSRPITSLPTPDGGCSTTNAGVF